MRVTLATVERRLFDLCVDVLVECYPNSYELSVALPNSPLPEADVYIWDYDEDLDLNGRLAGSQPPFHIVILESHHLERFKNAIQSGTMVVLKPATKPALSPWLNQAMQSANKTAGSDSRDRYIRMLSEANLRLQQFDHERMRFLAGALHDCRVPLTTNRGYCGILLNQQAGALNETQRDLLRCMQHSLQRMTDIISAAFQPAIGGECLSVNASSTVIDLRDCVNQAFNEIRVFADEKAIELRTGLDIPQRAMRCDRRGIERVLVNLLHNACKSTPVNGNIQVNGYPYFWERRSSRAVQKVGLSRENRALDDQSPNSFRVDVHNTGPQFAAERLAQIPGGYQSCSQPVVPAEHGLGLAICQGIIQQHRGKLWAENRQHGPMVSFVLPLSPKSSMSTADTVPPRSTTNCLTEGVFLNASGEQ